MQQFAQPPQIGVRQVTKQIDPAEIELRRQIHPEDFHYIFTPVWPLKRAWRESHTHNLSPLINATVGSKNWQAGKLIVKVSASFWTVRSMWFTQIWFHNQHRFHLCDGPIPGAKAAPAILPARGKTHVAQRADRTERRGWRSSLQFR